MIREIRLERYSNIRLFKAFSALLKHLYTQTVETHQRYLSRNAKLPEL